MSSNLIARSGFFAALSVTSRRPASGSETERAEHRVWNDRALSSFSAPVVVGHQSSSGFLITGLVVFELDPDARGLVPHETLQAVSTALAESGDAVGFAGV